MTGGPLGPGDVESDIVALVRRTVAAAFGGARPVRAVRTAVGGYSGGVYAVDIGAPDETYALRRHRLGAAAAAAEVTIATRLRSVVPVPAVHFCDADGSRVGAPVTLADWVPADLLATVLPDLAPDDVATIGHAVGVTLAGIGGVRFEQSGFFVNGELEVDGALSGTPAAAQLEPFVRQRLGDSDDPLIRAYVDLVAREAGALDGLDDPPALVHSDYNTKNILVHRAAGEWTVAGVIDWEFAFAGSPLADVANMLRHTDELPTPYPQEFLAGFRAGGGRLGEGWERRARVLDVFALVGFLADDGPLTAAVRAIARRCVGRGWI